MLLKLHYLLNLDPTLRNFFRAKFGRMKHSKTLYKRASSGE
jgi:hypothetical protein